MFVLVFDTRGSERGGLGWRSQCSGRGANME